MSHLPVGTNEVYKVVFSLRNFQHENLVKLYGVCTSQGPVFIIMELMSQGVWGCGLGYGCEEVMCAYVCVYVSVLCT